MSTQVVVQSVVIRRVNRRAWIAAYLAELSIYSSRPVLYRLLQNPALYFPTWWQRVPPRHRKLRAVTLISVPNVIGETLAQATATLTALQLQTQAAYAASVNPPGLVFQQTPAPGTPVPVGSTVVVTLPLQQVVPNVVGMYFYDAQLALLQAGFLIAAPVLADNPGETIPLGTVMSQSIPPGTAYPAGTQVQITITVIAYLSSQPPLTP